MASVQFLHALLGQFGVLNLLDSLVADLGQPSLEGFSLGAGNGLNDAKRALRVDDLCHIILAVNRG